MCGHEVRANLTWASSNFWRVSVGSSATRDAQHYAFAYSSCASFKFVALGGFKRPNNLRLKLTCGTWGIFTTEDIVVGGHQWLLGWKQEVAMPRCGACLSSPKVPRSCSRQLLVFELPAKTICAQRLHIMLFYGLESICFIDPQPVPPRVSMMSLRGVGSLQVLPVSPRGT